MSDETQAFTGDATYWKTRYKLLKSKQAEKDRVMELMADALKVYADKWGFFESHACCMRKSPEKPAVDALAEHAKL